MTQKQFQKKYGGEIIDGWLVFGKNKGGVYLSNNQLTSLPENIKFENKGSVYLSNNKLTKIPVSLEKRKNLYWR
mgnify:CR=1 FL=1